MGITVQINVWRYLPSPWMITLIVAGILSICVMSQPCEADYKSIRSTLFSVNLKEEPLGEVLKKISNDTGFKITIDPVWTGVPISASFNSLPIDQGLRRILSKLNHSLIFNESEHRIFIDIKSFSDGEGLHGKGLSRAVDHNPPGELRSLTVNLKDVVSPGDIQVIPPADPNGSGITLKELQEMEAQRVNVSPDDIEVIPPAEDGGKGVSFK
jgi:hypothetical protein